MRNEQEKIKYLTEQNIGLFLVSEYPDGCWVHNRQMPGRKFRPDYRSDCLKMVVEYDGHFHYTLSKLVVADEKKALFVKSENYKRIAMPFWLQLSPEIIDIFFGKSCKDYSYGFPHGFISDTVILPADFCQLGVVRFTEEMRSLPISIIENVVQSLVEKVKILGDWRMVVPDQSFLDVDFYRLDPQTT